MSQDYTPDLYSQGTVADTTLQHMEENFAALKSDFSGSTQPSNMVAGMWWFDTTSKYLMIRNEANNAWQYVWNFANLKPVVGNLYNEITHAMCSSLLKDPAQATEGLRSLGTGAYQACAGNDARLSAPPDGTVSQAKLKTGTQSQNYNISASSSWKFTLTGGQYCFYPTFKGQTTDIIAEFVGTQASTSYATAVSLYNSWATGTRYGYVIHRYITASGEVNWLFILRDKDTKEVVGRSIASDHPCFGNGGKPLLVPHPFGDYDDTKYEIIVVNPSLAEIDEMESMTIVEDESLPDLDILEVISAYYEIDESSRPRWPTKAVTVGLPKFVVDKKTKKKTLADYRFMKSGTVVTPIKKVIPKPDYIKVKRLKRKK